ncbi:flavodoxin family protein [Sporomusa sp.]|uniref:flavodoxin family protein n=1 Tax=Sporomusa sp. TaxID=2078658 RepID=UPI002B926DA5|nr:flavodoxin family protein [Sporomusa sp.]HWR05322.1 flavodoxin family protein [Sporomusa sp.]
MMKIIGLVGSPRKNGNTDVLVQKALEGARAQGSETELFHLNELAARGCQACYGCKKAGKCVINDDLTNVFTAIETADGIVLGSPIYFGRFTAQTATFMDRLYGYIKPDSTSSLGTGKKFGLVFTQGQPDASLYTGTTEATARVLARVGFVAGPGTLVGSGLGEPGIARENEQFLQAAFAIGQELANR